MITLDAFLVFVGAALLPVIYLFIVSRWIEPAYRQTHPETGTHYMPEQARSSRTDLAPEFLRELKR